MPLEEPKPLNLDELSDEDFLKLDPKTLQAVEADPNVEAESDEEVSDEVTDAVNVTDPAGSDNEEEENDTDAGVNKESEESEVTKEHEEDPTEKEEKKVSNPQDEDEEETEVSVDNENSSKAKAKEEKPAKAPDTAKGNNEAEDFFKKVSAPFKADGKDMQVRTAEDVIRLMQMGVNYSRRMQEMKGMRQTDAMLKEHGLDNDTLSFLIDVKNGKPEAIQKLLKDTQIDPMDIDTTIDPKYVPSSKAGDPKDIAFQEAIENTLNTEGGQSLINDVNAHWDDSSKDALRDHPQIFASLLEQKQLGQYEKIISELQYQRTMGYLTDVPFLQAYHSVGDAMQKAGVFGTTTDQNHSTGMAPVRKPNAAPIDTGPRKAASKPKTKQPNPDVSSVSSPRSTPTPKEDVDHTPDYSSMSDDDFLKLSLPG